MIFHYSDEEILEGIRQKNEFFTVLLYNDYMPPVRHFIRQNSGNHQDVQDIMHDTLLILYLRARNPGFTLSCTLKTYFFAIAKNLWMQVLDTKFRIRYQAPCEVNEPVTNYSLDDPEPVEKILAQYRLFFKHLSDMPNECRRLLELYLLKIPYKEIARMMKYKDEIYVKTRKYSCKNLLRKKILTDPDYQPYLDENEKRAIFQRLDRSFS